MTTVQAVAVETSGLRKVYGDRIALDDVDLVVPEGSVYGLVGRNGAGKTTLLGILAGLRRASGGARRVSVDRSSVAVLPDTPRFEPWLTAREIVDLARRLTDPSVPAQRVDEVLSEAGLEDAASRRIGGFSRGMLQRLGIAATVVARPRLLLLDEPAAALDPAGRREVLDLIGRLRGQATVVFSSHILGDVQEVCDHVGVLERGRLRFQGRLHDLLERWTAPVWTVRLRERARAVADALERQDWVRSVELRGAGVLRVEAASAASAEQRLVPALAGAGAIVVSIAPEAPTLEDVFLGLVADAP